MIDRAGAITLRAIEFCGPARAKGRARARSSPPPDFDPINDPPALRKRLEALSKLLGRWWRLFGEVAYWFKRLRLWRHLDCPSFKAYCTNRLGLCDRTVNKHIWLEKQLQRLPPLRAALDAGTLDFTRASAVAAHATLADVDGRIADAAKRPSLDVQQQAEDETDENLSAHGQKRLFGHRGRRISRSSGRGRFGRRRRGRRDGRRLEARDGELGGGRKLGQGPVRAEAARSERWPAASSGEPKIRPAARPGPPRQVERRLASSPSRAH